MGGGSLANAERNAGYESMYTAGSGLVNAISSGGVGIPLGFADHSNAFFNAFAPRGNACGGN